MFIFVVAVIALNLGGLSLIVNRREKIYGELPLSTYGLVFFMGIAMTFLMLFFSITALAKSQTSAPMFVIPGTGLALLLAYYIYQEIGIRALLAERRAQAEEALKKTLEFISNRPNSVPALENLARIYEKLGKADLARKAQDCARLVRASENAAMEAARSDGRRTL